MVFSLSNDNSEIGSKSDNKEFSLIDAVTTIYMYEKYRKRTKNMININCPRIFSNCLNPGDVKVIL